MKRVGIIGAGLAGLTLANALRELANVQVFEKSSGPGGRMATRYMPPYEFDHGAQFFTARAPEFVAAVERWRNEGVVAPWYARFAELDRSTIMAERTWDDEYLHFVATPRMNQLGKHLATGIEVRTNTQVSAVAKRGQKWQLLDQTGSELGPFDWVITTVPSAQASALLPESFAHAERLKQAAMSGCFALMLGFSATPQLTWDAALVHNADISWVSINSSKPDRPDHCSVLVHSTNAYAEANLESALQDVQQHLTRELRDTCGIDAETADATALHRWRYANIGKQDAVAPLIDSEQQLAACGDWCTHGRVEAAYMSALALKEQLRTDLF